MKNYPEGENGWIFELVLVVLVGILCWLVIFAVSRYLNRAEKAAYLEGRYDFDHATAWQIAGEEGR